MAWRTVIRETSNCSHSSRSEGTGEPLASPFLMSSSRWLRTMTYFAGLLPGFLGMGLPG